MGKVDTALYKVRFIKFQRLRSKLEYYRGLKNEAWKNNDFMLASDYRLKELEMIRTIDEFQGIKNDSTDKITND